jgi:hypothetical protein
MSKALQIIGFLVAVVALAAAGAAYYLGNEVEAAVEGVGSRLAGAPVEVGSLYVLPWSGEGVIRNLKIGAPDGFSVVETATVPSARFIVDLGSLVDRRGPLVVRSIEVRGGELTHELTPRGSTVGHLLDNVDGVARSELEDPTRTARKVVVGRMGIAGVSVRSIPGPTGLGTEGTFQVDSVELDDLGGPEGGQTVFALAARVAAELRSKIADAGVVPDDQALAAARERAAAAAKAVDAAVRREGNPAAPTGKRRAKRRRAR